MTLYDAFINFFRVWFPDPAPAELDAMLPLIGIACVLALMFLILRGLLGILGFWRKK